MLNSTDERIRERLDEIAKWLKLAYGESVRQRLAATLDTDVKKRAYEATDGVASTRDIGKLVGVDQKTISNWWNDWTSLSLVEPGTDRPDRPRKLISLAYFKMLPNPNPRGDKLAAPQNEESDESISISNESPA
jgi:hypothetical protein